MRKKNKGGGHVGLVWQIGDKEKRFDRGQCWRAVPHYVQFSSVRFQVRLVSSWTSANEAAGTMKLVNNRSGSRGLPGLSTDFTGGPVNF